MKLELLVDVITNFAMGKPTDLSHAIQLQDRCGGCNEVLVQDVQGHSGGMQHGSMDRDLRVSHKGDFNGKN